ncbi:MAG: hypothetical protein REJ50_14460 [Bordetella sp.]|nr:hypothetical protein [Bordetella sp.]
MLTRTLLSELGLRSWLNTSGGKGLHVVVPIAPHLDYDIVKDFSKAVVVHLARAIPCRFVTKSGPSNRTGKLFVNYLRNGHGATTAAAFSAPARPGLGVHADLVGLARRDQEWSQLDHRHCPGAPVFSDGGSMDGILERPPKFGRADAGARLRQIGMTVG